MPNLKKAYQAAAEHVTDFDRRTSAMVARQFADVVRALLPRADLCVFFDATGNKTGNADRFSLVGALKSANFLGKFGGAVRIEPGVEVLQIS